MPQTSDQAQRWAGYVGDYKTTSQGVMDPLQPPERFVVDAATPYFDSVDDVVPSSPRADGDPSRPLPRRRWRDPRLHRARRNVAEPDPHPRHRRTGRLAMGPVGRGGRHRPRVARRSLPPGRAPAPLDAGVAVRHGRCCRPGWLAMRPSVDDGPPRPSRCSRRHSPWLRRRSSWRSLAWWTPASWAWVGLPLVVRLVLHLPLALALAAGGLDGRDHARPGPADGGRSALA